MLKFLDAVQKAVEASAAGGKVWLYRAASTEPLPFTVMQPLPSGEPEQTTATHVQTEMRPIRFILYTTDPEDAADFPGKIETYFENNRPTFDSGRCLAVQKTSEGLELDPSSSEEGEEVWQGIVQMQFHIERTR